jgi:hypothetical protein
MRRPDPATKRQIPKSMMGRMLSLQELAQLEAKLTPKKPAAASVRRREPRKRSAG